MKFLTHWLIDVPEQLSRYFAWLPTAFRAHRRRLGVHVERLGKA